MKARIKNAFVLQSGKTYKRGEVVECKKGELPAEFIEELKEPKEEKPKAVKKNAGNSKARAKN